MKQKIIIAALALILPLSAAPKNKELLKPYPIKNCIVSDEELGEMGKPIFMKYDGQTYGFCCKPCTKDFIKDPKEYKKKLQEILKKQAKNKTKK